MDAKQFLETIQKDKELQSKFAGLKTPEQFYETAKKYGLSDSFEALQKTAKEMVHFDGEIENVDIEQLEMVAGGNGIWDVVFFFAI